jgi:hypothetical protein
VTGTLSSSACQNNIRPHQGAKNSTRAGFPDFSTTVSKLSGIRSMTAEAAEAPMAREANSAGILMLGYRMYVYVCVCVCDSVYVNCTLRKGRCLGRGSKVYGRGSRLRERLRYYKSGKEGGNHWRGKRKGQVTSFSPYQKYRTGSPGRLILRFEPQLCYFACY